MRWNKYFENIQKDIKLFLFMLVLICGYRLYFMFYMSGYMGDTASLSEILNANWAGFRLSLKSAGVFAAVTYVFGTLPNIALPKINMDKLRLTVGGIGIFMMTVLFQGRFPYYRAYNATYGMEVLQGANDDVQAIWVMMLEQYGLIWRFAIAILLTAVLVYIWKKVLKSQVYRIDISKRHLGIIKQAVLYFVTAVLSFLFMLFMRFGGSFDYDHSINWENASVCSDEFLNECVLDDIQALYRAHAMDDRMKKGDISGVDKKHVAELAAAFGKKHGIAVAPGDNSIKSHILHRAAGPKIAMPKHIFIILGESLEQWPLLDKYADLHVADGMKSLIAEENSYYTPYFMPNGNFTSVAITGIITGLNDVNVSINYQPRSFKEVYPTSIAEQFKRLGFRANFWYGGTPNWDNVKKLALAQGFDAFYGMPDFNGPKQSIWGTKDSYLFDAVENHLSADVPDINVIMTTTNHPPYNLDLEAEGFDLASAKAVSANMENLEEPETFAVEMGHYWYMDKEITRFVRETYAKYPDSIFIITGDHACRTNPSNKPTMFEYQSVPFILYGAGITHDVLPKSAVGGLTSIMPTLLELFAPQGYEYYSLMDSMSLDLDGAAFNRDYWLTHAIMGQVNNDKYELLGAELGAFAYGKEANADEIDYAAQRKKLEERMITARTLSWWLAVNGDEIVK